MFRAGSIFYSCWGQLQQDTADTAQVSGPAITNPSDRPGGSGVFYPWTRRHGTWTTAVSGPLLPSTPLPCMQARCTILGLVLHGEGVEGDFL